MNKKSTLFFIAGITLLMCINSTLTAQSFKDAVSYMQFMSNEYDAISTDMWEYAKISAHSKSAARAENKRKDLVNTVLNARKKISGMPDYDGSTRLRDSVVSFLNLSYHILAEDYAKVVDLEEIAEQSYDLMEAYLLAKEKAGEKMDQSSEMIYEEQKKFAQDHDITLVENTDKISKNLKVANEVSKYYNEIYLIFFKSNKQEAYMLDALSKNDINAVEQNRNTLLSFAREDLAKLEAIKGFNNDISLKHSCQQQLDFYVNEAENKIPVITDYYLKKERFDKIKAAFDAKSQSARTQDDVNQYNKAVDELNKATNAYNRTTQELNTFHKKYADDWNRISQAFFDRHVPK